MRLRVAVTLVLASLTLAGSALALTQPNGAPIPSPMGCSGSKPTGLLPVMACACTTPGVCNIGAPCPGGSTSCDLGKNGTCETTLWHVPNDNSCIPTDQSGLNPATAAQILPETFHPTCGQTFTVLSRGTASFQNIFGWYNATAGAPPDPSDLHVMVNCGDPAGKAVTLNVQTDPGYKGGDIGFFLVTPEDHAKGGSCAGANCCPSVAREQAGQGYVYYSQKEFDPDPGYIHLLNLPGTIAPNRFYFAWEDTFDTTSADFTDLVAAVDGVQCSGAGVTCDTGKPGVCALGITLCPAGSTTPACQGIEQPQPEACNGVDDNCDGTIDNGATCPIAGDVCVNGQCVARCGSAENPCSPPLACDQQTGECVDPKCIGVSCAGDQVCSGGTCVAACEGVVCPHGQSCVGSACVNRAGVTCTSGETCVEGACLPACTACGGVTCSAPLACDSTSGACVDPSCSQPCPAGTVCQAGSCVDGCTGVVCPAGGSCAAGACSSPGAPGSDGGISIVSPGGTSSGGGGPAAGVGPDGGVANSIAPGSNAPSSCDCSTPGAKSAADRGECAGAFFAALGVGGVLSRRRRRRAAA